MEEGRGPKKFLSASEYRPRWVKAWDMVRRFMMSRGAQPAQHYCASGPFTHRVCRWAQSVKPAPRLASSCIKLVILRMHASGASTRSALPNGGSPREEATLHRCHGNQRPVCWLVLQCSGATSSTLVNACTAVSAMLSVSQHQGLMSGNAARDTSIAYPFDPAHNLLGGISPSGLLRAEGRPAAPPHVRLLQTVHLVLQT